MNTQKAIIAVAGWGTRRLPITKTIEKCMLPVGDRPLVDWVVRDCIAAGIKDLYIVVSNQSAQVRSFYAENAELELYLRTMHKEDKLDLIAPLQDVKIHFVEQNPNGKYGTAVPVALCAPFIGKDERALVLMGDDFLYNADGSSEIAHFLEQLSDEESGLLAAQVAQEEVSKYGVIEKNSNDHFVQIVEKPALKDAPSNLINISKYCMSGALIKRIADFCEVEKPSDTEYYITDPINEFVKQGGAIKVVPARGEYLDGGSFDGWLHANQVVSTK